MRISWLALVPPAGFVALAAVFGFGMLRDDPDALPSAREGQVAPPVALATLGDLPGWDDAALQAPGVKLVNFWASWCAPCRVEHPNLVQLAEEGVTILGVNYKDDPDKALGFLAELGNPFAAIGADASGRIGLDWGLYGVPETFVIDAEGRVVLRYAGPITQRSLHDRIRPAIAEALAGG